MMNKIVIPEIIENSTSSINLAKSNHISKSIELALEDIDNERNSEKQLGLNSRWKALNIIQGKYWRFARVVLIASGSGHGKSFVLNMLAQDFAEIEDYKKDDGTVFRLGLNTNYHRNIAVLYFSLEQTEEDEIARAVSRQAEIPYMDIISSNYDYVENKFIHLSDENFEKVKKATKFIKNKPIYYITQACTWKDIYKTASEFKKLNPDIDFVVAIDHMGVIIRDNAINDSDFTQESADYLVKLKRDGHLVLVLFQLNKELQALDRISKPEMHHPKSSDIFHINKIEWACDDIYVFPYRPELYGIPYYSRKKIPTKDLVVCAKVKSRRGKLNEIYFKQKFDNCHMEFLTNAKIDKLISDDAKKSQGKLPNTSNSLNQNSHGTEIDGDLPTI